MSYKVLIPAPISETGKTYLLERGCELKMGSGTSVDALLKDVWDCDAILARTEKYPAEVLEAAPRLKVIARHGVGCDNVDLSTAEKLSIWVTVAGTANFNSVAEYGLGLIVALARKMTFCERQFRQGNFGVRNQQLGEDLENKVLGIVGFGKIGRSLAEKAHFGLGMKALTFDPYLTQDKLPEWVEQTTEWSDIFSRSDFLSLHLPYTGNVMVGEHEFSKMKQTAYFINLARGEIVDEAALIKALQEKQIAGAGLDVFNKEPPEPTNPLLNMENVIVTPHNAALTYECLERMSLQAAQGIWDVLNGTDPQWAVVRPSCPRQE